MITKIFSMFYKYISASSLKHYDDYYENLAGHEIKIYYSIMSNFYKIFKIS